MKTTVGWLKRNLQRSPWLYRAMKAARARIRAAREPGEGPPLPPEAFRARIHIESAPAAFEVGSAVRLAVEVTNVSPHTWPGGRRVAVSYHWRRSDGGIWAFDGGRTRLTRRLKPGASRRLECTVTPPGTLGTYVLELDLVYGRATWFSQHGSATASREIVVHGMPPDGYSEVDYEQIYLEADLTKNFWGVVGPASIDEFRQLGKGKLAMLEALGLRPESTILDVGCGTGSLAEAMLDCVSSAGLYYGTDLSEVAVQFCREKYGRPNFRFAKNGMTTLPIDDVRFDFIVFFSVFTHTYPEETRELLVEAVRLLNDDGMIIADVFEAEIEGDSLGTRAMLVLDRRRVLDIAEALDLEATTLFGLAWDPTAPRPIDRVMRRFSKRKPALNA